MDDSPPAHERASFTAARWALGGATAALVALASGATALLVVTSTTGVGLPVEEPHPLPGASTGSVSGSTDVLLLPGGSQPTSDTRARRDPGPGSDDPLLVLRVAGSRSAATTGLAARRSTDGASAPASAPAPSTGGAPPDGDAAAGVGDERPEAERPQTERPDTQRPEAQRPAPGRTPPAEEEPDEPEPATNPGHPSAEPRPQAPADDDDTSKEKGKGKSKGADKEKDEPQDEAGAAGH